MDLSSPPSARQDDSAASQEIQGQGNLMNSLKVLTTEPTLPQPLGMLGRQGKNLFIKMFPD